MVKDLRPTENEDEVGLDGVEEGFDSWFINVGCFIDWDKRTKFSEIKEIRYVRYVFTRNDGRYFNIRVPEDFVDAVATEDVLAHYDDSGFVDGVFMRYSMSLNTISWFPSSSG